MGVMGTVPDAGQVLIVFLPPPITTVERPKSIEVCWIRKFLFGKSTGQSPPYLGRADVDVWNFGVQSKQIRA